MTNLEYAKQLEIRELQFQLDSIKEQLAALGAPVEDEEDYYPEEEEDDSEYNDTKSYYSSQQSAYYDRDEIARENVRSGKWCEVRAAEFRVGA